MKRRMLIAAVCLVAAAILNPAISQAAPVTAGGIGTVSMTGWGCSTLTLGIDFELNGSDFLLQTGYFPPANPSASIDCLGVGLWNQFTNHSPAYATPCAASSVYEYRARPDTMTVSGSTYTFRNTFTFCSGNVQQQTTVITIRPTTIAFSHVADNDPPYADLRASGSLTRLW